MALAGLLSNAFFGVAFVTLGLGAGLVSLGLVERSQGLINAGMTVQSNLGWKFGLGAAMMLLSAAFLVGGWRWSIRIQNTLFWTVSGGLILATAVALFTSHGSFVSSFNSFLRPYTHNANSYQEVLSRAAKAGVNLHPHFSVANSIPIVGFFATFSIYSYWSTFVAGELREASSVKTARNMALAGVSCLLLGPAGRPPLLGAQDRQLLPDPHLRDADSADRDGPGERLRHHCPLAASGTVPRVDQPAPVPRRAGGDNCRSRRGPDLRIRLGAFLPLQRAVRLLKPWQVLRFRRCHHRPGRRLLPRRPLHPVQGGRQHRSGLRRDPTRVNAPDARSAVVTGAASGIGLAVAARLVRVGYVVVGLDRDQEALRKAASYLGEGFLPLICDLPIGNDHRRAPWRQRDARDLLHTATRRVERGGAAPRGATRTDGTGRPARRGGRRGGLPAVR